MHESGNTKDEILQYIYTNEPVTAHMISDAFKIHPTMTHRHLKSLFERNLIKKKGTPPKVYYFINNRTDEAVPTIPLERALVSLLDEHYYQRGADGAQRRGAHGFAQRCQTNGHNLEEKALAFQKQLNTIDSMKKDGCIDMTQDFVTTFRETELTQVRHADFFSIPTFERTKLGNLVLYGKQTSDKELIHEAASIVEPSLRSLIQRLAIDHVGLIPHTDTTKPLLFLPTLRSCMNL